MTKTPILLLSLLSFGCVQIPAAEGVRPAQDQDMARDDLSQDLAIPDLSASDLDAPDLPELPPDMPEMTAESCVNDTQRTVGVLAPDGVTCTPTGCQPGFLDANQDLSSPETDGCECKTLDIPGDGLDDNCDGFDGELNSSIFVSPLGGDINLGTSKDQPLRTLSAAIQTAQDNPSLKYILIAQGTYADTSIIMVSGVSLYGGFDPSTWDYNPDPSTTILVGLSNLSASTILADRLNKPTTIQNLTIKGPANLDKSGRTAYTIRANDTLATLSFIDCIIEGGTGADGADGQDGQDAMIMTPSMGNMGALSLCDAHGGRGGTSPNACYFTMEAPMMSQPGLQGVNSSASPGAGGAQGNNDCIADVLNCDEGGDGANGDRGGDGPHGAPPTLDSPAPFSPYGDWQPPQWTPGGDGQNAAGGGGGGAGGSSVRSESGRPGAGGGGGAGGCGATAATSGQSGGSSIALIAVKTKLNLVNTSIILGRAGSGGRGGKGGKGSLGTPGAPGSAASGDKCTALGPVFHGNGGRGGKGGDGGDGASGMGGCAGSLYGVVLDNNSVLNEEALLNLRATGGEPGVPGEGGPAPSDRSQQGQAGCVGIREEGVFRF